MPTRQPTLTRTSPAATQAGTVYTGQMGLGTYAYGSSDDALSSIAYASSPIHSGMTDDDIIHVFASVLEGPQELNTDFVALPTADGTATVPIDMSYGQAPTIDSALTDADGNPVGDGAGMPMGPRVPTTASPDDESTNAADQPAIAAPDHLGHSGDLGSVTSPSETSTTSVAEASSLGRKFSNLALGKSAATNAAGGTS